MKMAYRKLCNNNNTNIICRKQSKPAVGAENDEPVPEEDVVHHIPMAVILPQLSYLVEIYLNFGMIYMNDGFEWRDFE